MSGVIFDSTELPILNEEVLIYFATHCHEHLKLKWSTIKLYLAGIRYHYLREGRSNPFQSVDRLQYIIRAIKRSQNSITKPRFPIDINILIQICEILHRGIFSPYMDATLECMCLLAFFGFLRCSEFTVRSLKSPDPCLKIRDISISQDNSMFILTLTSSKTDPFRNGVQIPFYRNNKCCPVTCMIKYLTVFRERQRDTNSPLFLDSLNRPFSREVFLSYLREILERLGIKQSGYSGHSFRIGAATTAAAAGVEDHLIKMLGRWNSSCYARYIRVPRGTVEEAQKKLSLPK